MAESKITSLLALAELAEQSALEERLQVEHVIEQRQQIVHEMLGKMEHLEQQISERALEGKKQAIQCGRGEEAAVARQFQLRIEKQRQKFLAKLQLRQEELRRARERFEIVLDRYQHARVERRKLELLLEGRAQAQNILHQAREEASLDDENSQRTGPKIRER